MTILRLLPTIEEYSIPKFPWFRVLKVMQDLYHQLYVPLNIPQPIKPAGLTPPVGFVIPFGFVAVPLIELCMHRPLHVLLLFSVLGPFFG